MELKFILESLLFSAQKPLSVKELREVLANAAEADDADAIIKSLTKTKDGELTAALEQLAAEHETAARSYRLACVAGSWQFVTQPEFAPWLKAFVGIKARPPRLSQPALETLAIIAYRQPITRAEVEQIRGVNVDGTMQTSWNAASSKPLAAPKSWAARRLTARRRCSSNISACAAWKICPPQTNSAAFPSPSRPRLSRPIPVWQPLRRSNFS